MRTKIPHAKTRQAGARNIARYNKGPKKGAGLKSNVAKVSKVNSPDRKSYENLSTN